jgi:hypothetical protein
MPASFETALQTAQGLGFASGVLIFIPQFIPSLRQIRRNFWRQFLIPHR